MRRKDLIIAAAVTGFTVAAIAALFKVEMWRAQRRRAQRSKTVATTFGSVEYAIAGTGQPVLVIHGAAGAFDQGLHLTSALVDKGYRLIAASRFGYLRSALPRKANPATQAEAYAQLLDRLGIRQTAVLAISAGAWSALHFAQRYPERCRALVLLVPATSLPRGTKMYGGLAARTLFRSDFLGWLVVSLAAAFPRAGAAILGTPSALLQHVSKHEVDRIRQLLRDTLPVRAHARGMKLDIAAAHAREDFPMHKLTCPVLAVSAEDDTFRTAARAREISSTVPDGTAVIFATGGHLLVERQEEVVRAVDSFLIRTRADS